MADRKNTNNEKENKSGSYTQTGEPKNQNADRPRQGSKTRGGLSPNPRQNAAGKNDEADEPRNRRRNSSGSDGRHGGNR